MPCSEGNLGSVMLLLPETFCPVQVAPFRVATSPVTIGEYHVFAMAARGYERADLWAPADFAQFHGKGQVCTPLSVLLPAGSDYGSCSFSGKEISRLATPHGSTARSRCKHHRLRPSLLATYIVQRYQSTDIVLNMLSFDFEGQTPFLGRFLTDFS